MSPDTISSHSPPRCSCDAGSVSRRRAGDIHVEFYTRPWLKRPARHQTSVSLPTTPSHPLAALHGWPVQERAQESRPQELLSLETSTGPKSPTPLYYVTDARQIGCVPMLLTHCPCVLCHPQSHECIWKNPDVERAHPRHSTADTRPYTRPYTCPHWSLSL